MAVLQVTRSGQTSILQSSRTEYVHILPADMFNRNLTGMTGTKPMPGAVVKITNVYALYAYMYMYVYIYIYIYVYIIFNRLRGSARFYNVLYILLGVTNKFHIDRETHKRHPKKNNVLLLFCHREARAWRIASQELLASFQAAHKQPLQRHSGTH